MTRAEDWGAIADDAISAFELADTGGEVPFAYAYLIRGIARRSGWDDLRIPGYLDTLYSLRNPDGGWGLNKEFNVFSGAKHPADTTYTITMTDHVGPTLIEAYKAGRPEVALADISTLVTLVMTSQWCTFPKGKAIAYSRATAPGMVNPDTVTTTNNKDIHNVNASAAAFLLQANALNINYTNLDKRVVSVVLREVTAYQEASTRGAWWDYNGTGALADTDHCALQADCMYSFDLAGPLGAEVAFNILANGHDDEPAARIAWARLAGLPPAADRLSVDGTTTLWLVLADAYLAEVAEFITTCNTAQLGQIACWAARAADQAAEVL